MPSRTLYGTLSVHRFTSTSLTLAQVAGVVTENRCRLTNVDWTVDGDAIGEYHTATGH